MDRKCKEIFSQVQAGEELKNRTRAYLAEKTHGYTGVRMGRRRYTAYAAVCACLLFALLGGRWLYFTPVAEISIDINPSIELSVNRFEQVVSVNGFNEDGRALSNGLDVKYKAYTDALEQILADDTVAALLSDNEIMAITVTGTDSLRSAEILSAVEACTAGHRNTYCYFALSEEVAGAHGMGLSCGRYRAFLELQLLDPDITPEAVGEMTMREIRELLDSLSPGSENDPALYGHGENGHHGHDAHGRRWGNGRMG